MRKISSLLVAAALIATASISAFADDATVVNAAEKKVLDELAATITLSDGSKWVAGTTYYNTVENYFKTIDATDAQADTAITAVKKAKDILIQSNISDASVKTVSKETRAALLAAGREAVAPFGLEMNYDYVEKQLIVTDKAGEVVGKAKPALEKKADEGATKPTDSGKTTPTDGGKTTPTQGGGSSGSGTSGGNTSGKTVTDSDVIKTTGAGVDTSAVAGVTAAGVVVAAAGAVYAFKTRKERA